MILPIIAYGDPVLRKKTKKVDLQMEGLQDLIANMFETMYQASGVGLAAPQVGKSLRLFIVDASPFADDEDLTQEEQAELKQLKEVFINPEIIDEQGDEWAFNEGCLSIPDVREDVFRQPTIAIKYWDGNLEEQEKVFTGLAARVIQHEYDHIEGILFTDHLSSLKKRLIKSKLNNIKKGKVYTDYRMKFPSLKAR
jgi:peptide deformylase